MTQSRVMRSPTRCMLTLPLLLSACELQSPPPPPPPSAPEPVTIRALPAVPDEETAAATEQQRRLVADTLFEALQALDADRLMTPVDDNAHSRFMRVLELEPDNEIALQGLRDIAQRYVELSREASRRGLFQQAETMLERARMVDGEHPAIAAASRILQAERQSPDLFFNLDNREFARRTDAARARLVDIAQQARQYHAFFLITAPNDEQARWMFGVMREAAGDYRLRGNIELAGQTSIRLRIPRD